MKNRNILAIFAFILLAAVVWAGPAQLRDLYFQIGKGTGTHLARLQAYNLAFAGDTSKTQTVTAIDAGRSYFVAATWQSCSANQAKPVTVAVSGTTLTATAVSATTGTLSVTLIQDAP